MSAAADQTICSSIFTEADKKDFHYYPSRIELSSFYFPDKSFIKSAYPENINSYFCFLTYLGSSTITYPSILLSICSVFSLTTLMFFTSVPSFKFKLVPFISKDFVRIIVSSVYKTVPLLSLCKSRIVSLSLSPAAFVQVSILSARYITSRLSAAQLSFLKRLRIRQHTTSISGTSLQILSVNQLQ